MSSINISRESYGSSDRRLRYRELLSKLSSLDDDGIAQLECIEQSSSAVNLADKILSEGDIEEYAKRPGEVCLDARVLRTSSDVIIRCSEAISGNINTYDRHELASHMKSNPCYWDFVLPKEVGSACCLFGTFAPTPPEERVRQPRRRVERQIIADLQKPENVDKLDKTEEGSEMVTRVNRFITKTYRHNGQTPLSYFHVVLDPESFSRSIENVYYVSFLVRDGLISVDIDEDTGLPFLKPVAGDQQNNRRQPKEEKQFIVSIDMQRWEELIEVFEIVKPMMVLKRS